MGKITYKLKIEKLCKFTATFSVAFLLAFVAFRMLTPIEKSSALDCENSTSSNPSSICDTSTTDVNVSIEGSWTISVSSSGTLGLDLTPNSFGTLSTTTDNLNVYTNTPNGYQLYLNSTSGSTDIYNNNVLDENGNLSANLPSGTNTNHFSATTGTKSSPATLTNNTWGYSLAPSPTTFSKVELTNTSADSLISTGSKTTGAGDNIDVTYGFMADTKLTPGTYSTQVTYTAIADTPSYTLTSITPNRPAYNATNTEVTILTSTPVSELGLGDITAKIGTINLTNCTEITSGNYRGATCIYPGGLPAGRYNVELTSSWHNATYTLLNAFSINSMQEFTQTNCNNLPESTTTVDNRIDLVDSRDGKIYKVSKLADGNCWMAQNLALDGGITISNNDSDLPDNYSIALPYMKTAGSVNMREIQIWAQNSGYDGNYYNWCAAIANISSCDQTFSHSTSICPRSWNLPNKESDKSFLDLFKKSKILDLPNTEDKIKTVESHPYYFTRSGVYFNGYHDMNIGGYYHTNTPRSSILIYIFLYGYYSLDNPLFDPTYFGNPAKNNGISVRCVFGE